jgi:hypothetical protein
MGMSWGAPKRLRMAETRVKRHLHTALIYGLGVLQLNAPRHRAKQSAAFRKREKITPGSG